MKIENRLDVVDVLNQLFLNGKGVEIGSFKGEFAAHIVKNWNGKIYMVDIHMLVCFQNNRDLEIRQ